MSRSVYIAKPVTIDRAKIDALGILCGTSLVLGTECIVMSVRDWKRAERARAIL